jgi:hypothetical protein
MGDLPRYHIVKKQVYGEPRRCYRALEALDRQEDWQARRYGLWAGAALAQAQQFIGAYGKCYGDSGEHIGVQPFLARFIL